MRRGNFPSDSTSDRHTEPVSASICPSCSRPIEEPEVRERRGRPLKFPLPTEIPDEMPVTLRHNEDVVALYNQGSGEAKRAVSLSARVQEWCRTEARKQGWGKVYFPTGYPNRTAISGAVFVKKSVSLEGAPLNLPSPSPRPTIMAPRRSKRVE